VASGGQPNHCGANRIMGRKQKRKAAFCGSVVTSLCAWQQQWLRTRRVLNAEKAPTRTHRNWSRAEENVKRRPSALYNGFYPLWSLLLNPAIQVLFFDSLKVGVGTAGAAGLSSIRCSSLEDSLWVQGTWAFLAPHEAASMLRLCMGSRFSAKIAATLVTTHHV